MRESSDELISVCWQRPSAKETVFVAYGRCHPLDKIFFSPDEIFLKQVDEIPDRSLAVILSLPGLHSSVRLQVIAQCRETQTQGDTGRHREKQGDTGRHRETQRDTRRHRETQGDTRRHRETQGDTRRHREKQRDTGRHKETQGDTRRHRETQGHPTSQTLKPGDRHWTANRDLTPCPEII